jgi:8-oxo-dGTP diphosphatase
MRYMCIVDVHAVLVSDGRVLLGRRANTGFSDGKWHLPSGHLEPGESVSAATIREAAEEVGVAIDPADLEFAHTMHHRHGDEVVRVGFFFQAVRWSGTVHNAEPHKCDEVAWFAPEALPEPMVGYAAAAIGHIAEGNPFSLYGWGCVS